MSKENVRSLWMCCFSLAVSLGAALLLPVSIISNEVLLLYPSSFYMQWLNSSLIHGKPTSGDLYLIGNIFIPPNVADIKAGREM